MQMQRTFLLSEQQELQGGSGILIWVGCVSWKTAEEKKYWTLFMFTSQLESPYWLNKVCSTETDQSQQIPIFWISAKAKSFINTTPCWTFYKQEQESESGLVFFKHRFQTVIHAYHWEGCSMLTSENNLGPERSRQPSLRRFQIKWEQNLV